MVIWCVEGIRSRYLRIYNQNDGKEISYKWISYRDAGKQVFLVKVIRSSLVV